jgi:hypothetical protein
MLRRYISNEYFSIFDACTWFKRLVQTVTTFSHLKYQCGSVVCSSAANVLFTSFLKWIIFLVLYIRGVELYFAILVANFVLFFYSFFFVGLFVLFSE